MTANAAKDPSSLKQPAPSLKEVRLFAGLASATRQQFEAAAQIRHVEKGTVMYIQGDKAEWFYVIDSGWVKLFRETLEGSEAIIDILNEGHLFGEYSVFENDKFSYSVQVVEAVTLRAYPTKLLKNAMDYDPQLAKNMLQAMSHDRMRQHREIEHFNVQNAPQRIGCFLLRLTDPDVTRDTTLHLPYDKTLIAGRLGMKPETFSRALAKLKQETSIKVTGSAIQIPNSEQLADYVCSQCSSYFPCEDLLAERGT